MKYSRNSGFFEKTLALVFALVFLVFAVFFTYSNQEETKSDFDQERIEYTRLLAREVVDLLNRQIDISSKLSNVLSENSVAYAVVQQSDGTLLARSEGYGLPVGIFETAESEAIKAQYLTFTPFKDPSGLVALTEAAMPIYTNSKNKYILRVGYFRDEEEKLVSRIRFRNILAFSLIFIFFSSIWSVRHLVRLSLKYALIGSSTFVMVVLFFVGSYTIREWYGPFWQRNFVENECVSLTKMLIPGAIKMIDEKSSEIIEQSAKLLEENKSFLMASLIKDDVYIYHTDFERIGKSVENDTYRKSLNSDKASVFKNNSGESFYTMVPLMRGSARIGTICTVWQNDRGMEVLVPLRDKLTMIFVFSYLVLCWFMYQYSDEINNRIAGLIKNNNNSSKEISEVSIRNSEKVSRNLAATVFVYFSGIDEAINNFDGKQIADSVVSCCQLVKSFLSKEGNFSFKLLTNGVSVVFYGDNEQESVFRAIDFARNINSQIGDLTNSCFIPKITVNVSKLLNGKSDEEEFVLGESLIDYKVVSKVQGNNEIVLGDTLYSLIRDLVKCEKLEILSPECGKLLVYVFEDFYDSEELEKKYNNSLDWTKLMILRILKSDNEYICREYDSWSKTTNSVIKEKLLAYFYNNSKRS